MATEKRTTPRERRVTAAPLISLSLEDELEQLKKEPEWLSGHRNSVTLVKTSRWSIVLVALQQGSSMCGHEVAGPITVSVLSGAIRFKAGDQTRIVRSNGLLSLDGDISHEIEALEHSAFLLTVLQPEAPPTA